MAFRIIVFILCSGFIPARAELVSLTDQGVQIDGGTMGTFDCEYPTLTGDAADSNQKVLAKTITGNSVVLKYDKGSSATVTISGG